MGHWRSPAVLLEFLIIFLIVLTFWGIPTPREVPIRTFRLVPTPREVPIRTFRLVLTPRKVPIRTFRLVPTPREVPIRTFRLVPTPREVPIRTFRLVPTPRTVPKHTFLPILPMENGNGRHAEQNLTKDRWSRIGSLTNNFKKNTNGRVRYE